MIPSESIISSESRNNQWNNPASIAKLQNGTKILVWWIQEIPNAEYQTYRWLSDKEKELIDSISAGNVVKIHAILSNYI